jgi:hypothetical protein
MSVEKGFVVKNMKDKTSHNIVVCWNEFIKLLKIKKDESQKDFQKGSNHTFTNFEGYSGLHPTKKQKKGKHKLRRKRRL